MLNQSRNVLLDEYAVSQLVMRERQARETHDFDAEAACFHPDAGVEVSWFSGTATEFVEAGRKSSMAGSDANAAAPVFFDSMSPAAVWVKGDRAIADTSCAVHMFAELDGVGAHVTSYSRLLWRAQRYNSRWLIAGLHGIYIRDTLEACNPAQVPVIDLNKLAGFRSSYKHLSYLISARGGPVRNDRAGVDRPDLVAALRAAEQAWLNGQTESKDVRRAE
ncbi:hypothetical protein F3J17_19395 [Burkholderia sp. Ax-1719]|nr:hypothetical protein [Burkholderia sp. Ax-1719]